MQQQAAFPWKIDIVAPKGRRTLFFGVGGKQQLTQDARDWM
jgi:hypothetical protein